MRFMTMMGFYSCRPCIHTDDALVRHNYGDLIGEKGREKIADGRHAHVDKGGAVLVGGKRPLTD